MHMYMEGYKGSLKSYVKLHRALKGLYKATKDKLDDNIRLHIGPFKGL